MLEKSLWTLLGFSSPIFTMEVRIVFYKCPKCSGWLQKLAVVIIFSYLFDSQSTAKLFSVEYYNENVYYNENISYFLYIHSLNTQIYWKTLLKMMMRLRVMDLTCILRKALRNRSLSIEIIENALHGKLLHTFLKKEMYIRDSRVKL